MARPALPADFAEVGTWAPILRAAVFDTSDRADGQLPRIIRTGSYTLTVGDIATTVYMNAATANTLTVPTGLGTAEQRILVRQRGAGTTTIAAGTGMTLTSAGKTAPFAMAGVGAVVEIVFFSGTEAYVDGALA